MNAKLTRLLLQTYKRFLDTWLEQFEQTLFQHREDPRYRDVRAKLKATREALSEWDEDLGRQQDRL